MSQEFGRLLDFYIKLQNSNQSRVAKAIGVERSHLNRMVAGERNAGLETSISLADFLKVPDEERANFYLLGQGYSVDEVSRILNR